MTLSISNRGFNGACLLSAVGSLPMHVMPILIASAILADRVTATQAGLLAAMYAFGQLFITTALPLFNVKLMRSSWAFQVSAFLVFVMLVNVHLYGNIFYLNWFLIGLCCGILSYLGSTSAAAVQNKSFAFAVRLGVTLLVAGLTMLVFFAIDKFVGFEKLTVSLAIVIAVLCIVGLILYSAPIPQPDKYKKTESVPELGGNIRWGLAYLFWFSFAQVGFIVFAVESALQRGINISDALWAFALCKIFAAALLLVIHSKSSQGVFYQIATSQSYIIRIPVLMVACFLVSTSETMLLFFIGILLWETSVNLMSSSFQASIVEVNPAMGGMYLTSVLLFGSAFGPIANGLAISNNIQDYFYCVVIVSVFLPLFWECHKGYSGQSLTLRDTGESK